MVTGHKFTPCGDLIRVTVFSDRGTSSKTCRTMDEANAFLALVKARGTSLRKAST